MRVTVGNTIQGPSYYMRLFNVHGMVILLACLAMIIMIFRVTWQARLKECHTLLEGIDVSKTNQISERMSAQ
jgi:hypothetical protein